jgi:hypothetical protein
MVLALVKKEKRNVYLGDNSGISYLTFITIAGTTKSIQYLSFTPY